MNDYYDDELPLGIWPDHRLTRAEGRGETVSEVCGFHCPACGNDGVAFMLEGRIVALPHAPALRCQHCETEFRVALYAAEGRSDE